MILERYRFGQLRKSWRFEPSATICSSCRSSSEPKEAFHRYLDRAYTGLTYGQNSCANPYGEIPCGTWIRLVRKTYSQTAISFAKFGSIPCGIGIRLVRMTMPSHSQSSGPFHAEPESDLCARKTYLQTAISFAKFGSIPFGTGTRLGIYPDFILLSFHRIVGGAEDDSCNK